MKKSILDFKDKSFNLFIYEDYEDNEKLFCCELETNSELFCFKENDYMQLCSELFASFKTVGKIVAIKEGDFSCKEKEIKKVKINYEDFNADVYLHNGKKVCIDLNIAEIETECFDEEQYSKTLNELKKLIKKAYNYKAA